MKPHMLARRERRRYLRQVVAIQRVMLSPDGMDWALPAGLQRNQRVTARYATPAQAVARDIVLLYVDGVFGDAVVDRSHLDGDFEEFFFRPLHESRKHRVAAGRLLKSFNYGLIDELESLHRRIDVPVALVWGEHDRFFPVEIGRAHV